MNRPIQDFLRDFPRSAAAILAMERELKVPEGGAVDAAPVPRNGPPDLKLDDKFRIVS
jgi:hypothetical protein